MYNISQGNPMMSFPVGPAEVVLKLEVGTGNLKVLPEGGDVYIRQIGPMLVSLWQQGLLRIVQKHYDVDAQGWVTIASITPAGPVLVVNPTYQEQVVQAIRAIMMGGPPGVVSTAPDTTGLSADPVADMLAALLDDIDNATRIGRVFELLLPDLLDLLYGKDVKASPRREKQSVIDAILGEGKVYVAEGGEIKGIKEAVKDGDS